jgi:hypothetical protein
MHTNFDAAGSAVDWRAVWSTVAESLTEDSFVPKFLTEDAIRIATLHALNVQLDVIQCADTEYPAINLEGEQLGRLDLVVQAAAGATVVEFKYPREPRQTLPPWPDHLGGVLSDTYRLGILTGSPKVERCIQVLVSAAAFLGYVRRTTMRLGLAEYASSERTPHKLRLTPELTLGLAATTRGALKNRDRSWEVTANRSIELAIGEKGLWLAAYTIVAQPR